MNRVAKSMDSVFANCTDSELDFEVMFDDDDSLIDLVAGVNEAGEWITGPNPEETYVFQLDEDGNDIISDKDDAKQRAGVAKDNHAPEGSAGHKPGEFDSPEGMSSEISGSNSSAEHHAHDLTAAIKNAIKEAKCENADGPLTDNDEAAREGKCNGCGNPVSKCTCSNVNESLVNRLISAYYEADGMAPSGDSSTGTDEKKMNADMDKMDSNSSAEDKKIEQEAEKNAIKEAIIAKLMEANVESRTDDTFEKELSREHNRTDTLTDEDDGDLRAGKVKYNSGYKEAIKQKVLGVKEAVGEEITGPAANKETVPDCVQTNSASNNIVPDVETQSNDSIQPASETVEFIKNMILSKMSESVEDEDDEAVDESEELSLTDRILRKVSESYEDDDEALDEEEELSLTDRILQKMSESSEEDDGVVYKGWLTNVTEAARKPKVSETELLDDDDDADIEAIDSAEDSGVDLNVDYTDDELIDMAMNGKI